MRPSDGEPSDEWATARHYANLAGGLTQVVVVAQIMCGFELIELQRRAGLQRGRKAKQNGWLGSWPALVKEKIGRSDETARNWMNMAKAACIRLDNPTLSYDARSALKAPPSKWTDEDRRAIFVCVKGLCSSKTQSSWMAHLGLRAIPKRKNKRIRKRVASLALSDQAARWSVRLLAEVTRGLRKNLPALTSANDLTAMGDSLRDLMKQIESALPSHQPGQSGSLFQKST